MVQRLEQIRLKSLQSYWLVIISSSMPRLTSNSHHRNTSLLAKESKALDIAQQYREMYNMLLQSWYTLLDAVTT